MKEMTPWGGGKIGPQPQLPYHSSPHAHLLPLKEMTPWGGRKLCPRPQVPHNSSPPDPTTTLCAKVATAAPARTLIIVWRGRGGGKAKAAAAQRWGGANDGTASQAGATHENPQ